MYLKKKKKWALVMLFGSWELLESCWDDVPVRALVKCCVFLFQVTDLLKIAHNPSGLPAESLTPSSSSLADISALVDQQLQAAWNWLAIVLDCTEAQLRFGSSLSAATDLNQASHLKVHRDRRNREDPALVRALETKRKRSIVRR